MSYSRFRRSVIKVVGGAFWRVPGRFEILRKLGPSYSLRCVVFHNISETESPFTKGMSVTITPARFRAALRFLTTYYTPVSLERVLTNSDGRGLPPRAVLVTFDDAYASVAALAAPLCRQFGVPAVFFVNGAFLDSQRLAPDNLVCYVANVLGMDAIRAATRAVAGSGHLPIRSLSEVFSQFFPSISVTERDAFLDALKQLAGINEGNLAKDAGLYLSSSQLSHLASLGFEIGNHTYSHVHCRVLSREDFASQVDRNQARLEAISKTQVRSFSQPYGSSRDFTPELAEHLKQSGYKAVFFSESVANARGADPFHFDRVSIRAESNSSLFCEIEALPRLRAVRNRFSNNRWSGRPYPGLRTVIKHTRQRELRQSR